MMKTLRKNTCILNKGDLLLSCHVFPIKNIKKKNKKLINEIFKSLINKTIDVYMNDMIIKRKRSKDHAIDISEDFDILDKVRMKIQKMSISKSKLEIFSNILSQKKKQK